MGRLPTTECTYLPTYWRARLIRLVREYVDRKHLSLQYVRGLSGNQGNQDVDRRAKIAINLCNLPLKWEMSLIVVNCSRTVTQSGLDMRHVHIDTKEYGPDVGNS